jgi:23S rRNA (uridine2552-2'-O)-methyltransferase
VAYERKDAHYRRAKAAGYRARSAYKLIELDDRYGILHPADLVVDLGAWPGAWLQVAGERVAPRGRVVGIDLVAVTPLGLPHVSSLVGDVRSRSGSSTVRTSSSPIWRRSSPACPRPTRHGRRSWAVPPSS